MIVRFHMEQKRMNVHFDFRVYKYWGDERPIFQPEESQPL